VTFLCEAGQSGKRRPAATGQTRATHRDGQAFRFAFSLCFSFSSTCNHLHAVFRRDTPAFDQRAQRTRTGKARTIRWGNHGSIPSWVAPRRGILAVPTGMMIAVNGLRAVSVARIKVGRSSVPAHVSMLKIHHGRMDREICQASIYTL